jgi:hypothetical protein
MALPFTIDQFFEVIQRYNEAVWPLQAALTTAALLAVALLFFRRAWANTGIWAVLTLLWLWTAVAYHFAFFTRINPAAYLFAAVFVAGAASFVWFGIFRRSVTFSPSRNGRTLIGAGLVVYALVVYPLWSAQSGHPYPTLPTFGLPCPTTIFTIGLLCMASGKGYAITLIAPIVWSIIGVQAAFLFGVVPDLGLGVAGLIAIALAVSTFRDAGRAINSRAWGSKPGTTTQGRSG